jgi:hypothetical protein
MVAIDRLVDVDQDTWVVVLVELSSGNTVRLVGSIAGDLEVDALRVVLSAVLVHCGVKGDDFVAEDVVARSDAGGDLDGPW